MRTILFIKLVFLTKYLINHSKKIVRIYDHRIFGQHSGNCWLYNRVKKFLNLKKLYRRTDKRGKNLNFNKINIRNNRAIVALIRGARLRVMYSQKLSLF